MKKDKKIARRDLAALAALLVPAPAGAQSKQLPSKTYPFEKMPVRENGANKSRAVFAGETHSGFPVDIHLTELGPGLAPHPPHKHEHEEIVMIKDGTLEVTISGQVSKLGPGSVAYVHSNEEHGWRNVGTGRALYFVLALGRPV